MHVITAIKPQKNNKRVNIYIDSKFGFGLDLENYMKLGLKVGQQLDTRKINEIVKKAEFTKTFDKLLRFAMIRPRSIKEIEMWFSRKKVHESIHKDLFNKLKRFDLLDDQKFAKWWVRQRIEFKPRGAKALTYELLQKGVDRKFIQEALNELVDESSQLKMAKLLLEKKEYKWKRYDDEDRKRKQSEFLQRRGFSWSLIKEAIG